MENRDMIRMANQIAAFFEAYPRPEAIEGVAKHITSFWALRMRKQLVAYVEAGGEELSPLVIAAFAPKAKPKSRSEMSG